MEVGGRVVSARVVSRVVLGFVSVILRGWEAFIRTLLLRWVEVGSCKECDQECSCSWDHSLSLGEELERVNRMTRNWKEMELGDKAFFPHA
ncbi:hypothetical protein Tco_1248463 [Tanacetum coccineum]